MSKITVEQAKQKILKTIVDGLPLEAILQTATAYKTLCEAELIETDIDFRAEFGDMLLTADADAESEGH